MGNIELRIHPLFFAFGFYYALTGRILVFVVYTISAVIHELGHSFTAEKTGYKLNLLTLTPFGATASGNVEGLKLRDELLIALSGPFVNLLTGVFVVALWWIFPESYAFTDVVAEANFTIALINFIPVFPLDGGRVAEALFGIKFGREKAEKTCRAISLLFSLLPLAGFITTVVNGNANVSLALFSAFALTGAFGKRRKNEYSRIASGLSEGGLKRGMEYKKTGVDKSMTLKKLSSLLSSEYVNEVVVYDGDEPIETFSPKRLKDVLMTGDIYSQIGKYVGKTIKNR